MGQFDNAVHDARQQAANGDLIGALGAANRALMQMPQDQNLKLFRARLLHALGRDTEALADLKPFTAGPMPAQLALFVAEVAEHAGVLKLAEDALGQALSTAKKPATLLAKRAVLRQSLGAFEAAQKDLRDAIKRSPTDGELYRLLGSMHRFKANDPLLKKMQQARRKIPAGSAASAHLEFAISKALDDLGDYDRSFKHLTQANATMRKLHPYSAQVRDDQLARYKQALSTLPHAPAATASKAAPIFVTGLPRSGTTLVEQILSAHPDVTGGGEMAIFGGLMRETLGDPAGDASLDLTPETLSKLGHAYADAVAMRHPSARRVTDKSIQTASYAGAVAAALPNARIIVVRRNPHGNALSLLRQVFQPGKQLFSYNLDDILRYQRGFDDMVAFWQATLPDRVHVVEYETLVREPDATTRALLDMADLPWNDACLHPEDNTRAVQTLSAVAVRKPISSDAADKWRRYASHLGA